MKKSDLECGNVVELRNGDKYLYHFTTCDKLLNLSTSHSYLDIYTFNEDLTNCCNLFDAMKVYKDYTCNELLWERKEKPKLTEAEKIILTSLPKKYKWIARDKGDNLSIFVGEPIKLLAVLSWGEVDCEEKDFPFDDLFQFIQWEDKKPYSIEELLGEE